MRPHGRARVSSRNPQAFGICDRCGFLYNHNRLAWQFDWAGASQINKRILVCDMCNDVPQQQLRAIVVPADPVPISNPRTQDYRVAETNYRITQGNTVDQQTGIPVPGGDFRITEDDRFRVTQQTGEPPGGLNQLPGTDWNAPAVTYNGRQIGLPYDNDTVPFTGPLYPPDYDMNAEWNNQWNFGILTGYYWENNSNQFLAWNVSLPSPAPPVDKTDSIVLGLWQAPGIAAYAWDDDDGFVSKYDDPITPISFENLWGVDFSPSKNVIAASGDATPYIAAYQWDVVTGFGTKYADPAVLPSSSSSGNVTFAPSNAAIAVTLNSGPRVNAYQWDDVSGFGSKYSNPSPTPIRPVYAARFDPNGDAIIAADSFGNVYAYQWSDATGFGSLYSNPSSLPNNPYGMAFSPSGDAVAIADYDTVPVVVYPWSSVSGFGSKYSDPSILVSDGFNVTFSSSGSVIAISNRVSPNTSVYPWDSATGFGAKYSNPAVNIGSFAWDCVFSAYGSAILFAINNAPGVCAYAWSDVSGFGTKYADPAIGLTTTSYSIASRG